MTADVGREVEALDLSALEFDPPCEYSMHDRFGDGPAVWAVLMAPPRCGHGPLTWAFFCGQCWSVRGNPDRTTYCDTHEHYFPAMSNVLRVERIRPPSSP